jgi:CBS domain containing-hemolysin-like protein
MTPAIWFCSLITGLITRHKTADSVSPDELKIMARLSLRMGDIKPYQESVIDNILSLETITVKDVMTPRTVILSLSEHLTIEEASQKSDKWEHSRFPVYDKDTEDIVGIVLTKELFIAHAMGKGHKPLTELMRPARFVVETATLNNVLTEFMSSRQHLFVVIDEYGGLSGLIALEDILEVRGNICSWLSMSMGGFPDSLLWRIFWKKSSVGRSWMNRIRWRIKGPWQG